MFPCILIFHLDSISLKFYSVFKDKRLSSREQKYLQKLVYNGFYCFELLTERRLDDGICGVCGTIGQCYFGDGNQKNCCSLKEVWLSVMVPSDHMTIKNNNYGIV